MNHENSHSEAHSSELNGSGHAFLAAQTRGEGRSADTAAKSYKPFFNERTPRRYSRSRVVDVRHIKLDLSFEIQKKKLNGVASITVVPIDERVDSLTLDACDMTLGEVKADGHGLTVHYDGAKLRVDFDKPLPADKEVTLTIPYSVTKPRAGIYFIGPDKHYPDKPVEIWTQGQDEDSRYWFPCFDYPNEKATTEVVATVPANFNTLSNGKLLSVVKQGENKVYHWRHDVPHVAYLVTLVVGEFIEVKDEWDGIPVTYFHHPGDENIARNAFAETPKMVKFFSEKIGVRYPYAKYSQIPVTDFIFGGMENTTATTQTAYTLHDDRAHLDFSSNPLVSHELGHQWFGNLLTCRDWSHGWLNEGFTTYLECCWAEEEKGKVEFGYHMLMTMEGYLNEDRNSYRRPIVCNRYDEPIELFDGHLYNKGACVQHMLRFILGEKLYWKALKLYTERHAGGCVITQDWAGAIEDATGRNMDEFFDQWVYGGGHPDFKLGFSYDAAKKLAALSVAQTQQPDDLTAVFKLPVTIAFTRLGKHGKEKRREERTIQIENAEQTFNLPLDFEPDFITFDVGNWLTKTLDLSAMPETALARQLAHDGDGVARVFAARELGKRPTRNAVTALGEALAAKEWFVAYEAALALGNVGNDQARDLLLENLRIEHPKARRGVVKALGSFRNEKAAADALIQLLKRGDPSYFVEAEACIALGKTRDPRAKDTLSWCIDTKESHNEVIRIEALSGLVELEDVSALDKIRECCRIGTPVRLRYNAFMKLGALAKLADENRRAEVRRFIEEALEESDFFISMGTIAGLVALGEPDAAAALRRKERISVDGRLKARARKAAAAVADKASAPKQVKELRDELDEVKKNNRKLLERLETLEAATGIGRPNGRPGDNGTADHKSGRAMEKKKKKKSGLVREKSDRKKRKVAKR